MKILLALTLLFVLSLASFPQTRPDLKAYTVYARSDDFAYLIKDDSTKKGNEVTFTVLIAEASGDDADIILNPNNYGELFFTANCSTKKFQRIKGVGVSKGQVIKLDKQEPQTAKEDTWIFQAITMACTEDPTSLSA